MSAITWGIVLLKDGNVFAGELVPGEAGCGVLTVRPLNYGFLPTDPPGDTLEISYDLVETTTICAEATARRVAELVGTKRRIHIEVPGDLTDEQVHNFISAFQEAMEAGAAHSGPLTLLSSDTPLTDAAVDVLREREKQRKRYGDDHDDTEHIGALKYVAAFLCTGDVTTLHLWSDPEKYDIVEWAIPIYNKNTARNRLVIAAALALAEVERMDRADQGRDPHPDQIVMAEPGRAATEDEVTLGEIGSYLNRAVELALEQCGIDGETDRETAVRVARERTATIAEILGIPSPEILLTENGAGISVRFGGSRETLTRWRNGDFREHVAALAEAERAAPGGAN